MLFQPFVECICCFQCTFLDACFFMDMFWMHNLYFLYIFGGICFFPTLLDAWAFFQHMFRCICFWMHRLFFSMFLDALILILQDALWTNWVWVLQLLSVFWTYVELIELLNILHTKSMFTFTYPSHLSVKMKSPGYSSKMFWTHFHRVTSVHICISINVSS